jgi:hypothetical protein
MKFFIMFFSSYVKQIFYLVLLVLWENMDVLHMKQDAHYQFSEQLCATYMSENRYQG